MKRRRIRRTKARKRVKRKKGVKSTKGGYKFTISAADRRKLNNALMKLQRNVTDTARSLRQTLIVLGKL